MHSRLHSTPRGLRLLALVLLALGLLVKPVLVAGCELEDMRLAAGDPFAALVVDAASGQAGDECCPGQACGECCTAGTVLPKATASTVATHVAARPADAALAEPAPAPRGTAIRPPITA